MLGTYDSKLGLHLNDGGSTIIINTKCPQEKIPQGFEAFYAYIGTGEVDESDPLVCRINESVERANYTQEVESVMTLEEEMKIQSEYAREEGFERGEKLGLERGAAQKQREIAKEMLSEGVALATISKCTKLSVSEIEALQ